MRRIWFVAALLCAALPGTAAAKTKFPYVAYVAADRAPLRCGPGEEHYATDRLDRGTKVEVHRHDPGGWYAVRPLPGSFSWVPARQLEMTDEADLAEVKEEGVVAYVGTKDAKVRDLGWQIEFKKGDLVEVLGAKKLALAEGEPEELCFKIAPPSGEFRWLKNMHVTRRGADELVEEALEETAMIDAEVKPAALLAPAEAENSAPPLAPAGKSNESMLWKKRDGTPTPAALPTPANTTPAATEPVPSAGTQETDYDARLRELDVELSLMVAREPANWNLAPLRQRAAQHMDAGQTALERGRARLLVERIDEFAEFAKRLPANAAPNARRASAPTLAESTATKPTSLVAPNTPTPADPETKPKNLLDTTSKPIGSGVRGTEFAPDIDPRYDGLGWLMPVHSQTRSSPPYALQDSDGKILQYITPAPGLNLNRYLRSQVGIYGQRGFVTHLKTPHLTAQRVVSLERHKR